MRCAATAAEIRTICTKAGVPSCIRVPPLTGAATSGRPSRVARSMPATIRSAAARPIEPARKPNSPTSTATRRPCIRASPVSTDSSTPRLLGRGGQLGGVRLADAVARRRGVPRGPRALVEDQVDEVVGGEASHAGRVCLARLPTRTSAGSALRHPGRRRPLAHDPAVEERRQLAPGLLLPVVEELLARHRGVVVGRPATSGRWRRTRRRRGPGAARSTSARACSRCWSSPNWRGS